METYPIKNRNRCEYRSALNEKEARINPKSTNLV
jgi:hypothetical protein